MYQRVGAYPGPTRPLVAPLAQFGLQPSREGYATTPWEAALACYRPLLADTFPGEWTYAIAVVIWPNGTIPPHEDGDTQRERSQRYHLVLQSSQKAWVLHDGTWQQLDEGGIYTMDPLTTHAAVNWGGEPRIHLVVDVRQSRSQGPR